MDHPANRSEDYKHNSREFECLIPIKNNSVVVLNRKIKNEDLEMGVVTAITCFQLLRTPICKN